MLKVVITTLFSLLISVNVIAIELEGELSQGALIRGKAPSGSQVWLDGKALTVSEQGYFVFGFGRDAELKHELSWQAPKQPKQQQDVILKKREYDVQRIEGLPPKMVTPPEDVLARIRLDNQQVAKARSRRDPRVDFMQTFIWPAEGPISGVYGSQRVLNGQPKRPHFGVDVAAPTGTSVYAPADGIVTLWVPDMYYSGGTMIIDHGHGVSSTFLHLHAGHVKVGDIVQQGQLVAEIGATGRVTGAHLDWRMNWQNQRVDPALLVPQRPSN
ncbi:M23 family metallopeptidase [Aliiglaciecola sp. 3_MG-2023]|uniref:M23 family metallopeptidase n=1 Tax=Aliiglaciecola sp. 3_MG-2023 TaxID=3062644 RepID=UPI0026E42936|nr:M23 family metallopeptidase [Aliiglaciecola sp. 3_MG-2023]MDO6693416.1 M23 family metallopeptidase [Aliiglaciecola sp. 3_MG-2023]